MGQKKQSVEIDKFQKSLPSTFQVSEENGSIFLNVQTPMEEDKDATYWVERELARVFFTVMKGHMVLLHAFIKKAQKTPRSELDTARARKTKLGRRIKRMNKKAATGENYIFLNLICFPA